MPLFIRRLFSEARKVHRQKQGEKSRHLVEVLRERCKLLRCAALSQRLDPRAVVVDDDVIKNVSAQAHRRILIANLIITLRVTRQDLS